MLAQDYYPEVQYPNTDIEGRSQKDIKQLVEVTKIFDYEAKGRKLESLQAGHFLLIYSDSYQIIVSVCFQKNTVLAQ